MLQEMATQMVYIDGGLAARHRFHGGISAPASQDAGLACSVSPSFAPLDIKSGWFSQNKVSLTFKWSKH